MTETTYTLKHPITVEGHTTTELNIRRPKVGDLRAMERKGGSQLEKTFFLLGRLSSLSPAEVDEIDAEDLEGLGEIISGFTGEAPE